MSNCNVVILEQAIDLLSGIGVEAYQKQLKPHFSSSIGAHIRHIVDHFLALIDGHEARLVDYNIRHRHNDIEQNPDSAIQRLKAICDWLNSIDDSILDTEINVVSEVDINRTCSANCKSTLERELVFIGSHAIHHYALIKILCGMQSITVPEYFGYAPATITHIRSA